MGFLAEIFGQDRKAAGRTIADVEAALARCADEKRSARQAVTSALQKRADLLLIDGSDSELAAGDAAVDRGRLLIERIEVAEPKLISELQSLRDDAKRKRWKQLEINYADAAAKFCRSLREALKAHDAAVAARAAAQASGFGAEAAAWSMLPRILTPDAIALYEIETDRLRDNIERRPAPPVAAIAALPANAKAATPPPKHAAPTFPTTPIEAPFSPTVDADGAVRVQIMKAGIPFKAGAPSPLVGDIILLPIEKAGELVRAGAAEFVDFLEREARKNSARRHLAISSEIPQSDAPN